VHRLTPGNPNITGLLNLHSFAVPKEGEIIISQKETTNIIKLKKAFHPMTSLSF
jgi:hypothetical protein